MNKKLQKLIMLLIAFTVVQARAQQVSVTSTAGSGSGSVGVYTSLNGVFSDINSGVYQGDVDIRIHSSFSMSASAILNASGVGSASYTTVLIRPADTATVLKQISTTTAALNLIDLNGADSVVIDGRAGGIGSTSLLEFFYNVNTTGASTNVTMRINNGSTRNEFRYVSFTNASSLATSGAANINIINSSSGFGANSNNTIRNCTLKGARNSIIQDGTNNQGNATTDNLIIINNSIFDFNLAGVNLGVNIGSVTIDSNLFYHSTSYASNTSPRAISVGATTATTRLTANITKNRIYDIKSTLAGSSVFGMILNLTTSSSGNVINVYNNSIALMQTNANVNAGFTGGCNGILTQGNNPGTYNIYNNTVRIGGVSSGSTSSTVRGYCLMVFNNNALTDVNVKNNLLINTRTGNTTTGVANNYLAAIYYYSTPRYDVNYNVYSGSPWTLGVPAATGITITTAIQWSTNDVNSLTKVPTFSSTQQPYLSGASLADADLSAPRITSVPADIDNNTRSATCYKGAYEATGSPFITNDLQARIIYTYGKIPVGTLDSIRVRVKNNGISAQTGSVITLNITGANPATITYTIPSIAALSDVTYTLPGFTPANLGYDTLTATVPGGDQNTTNDTVTWIRENTLNALSYTRPFLARTGNLGTNPQGELLAKFNTPVNNFVNQVNVDFSNNFFSPQSFAVVIYEDSGSTWGPKINPLWVSSTQTTVNGVYNLSVPSIAISSGNFYVGVRQTTTNNIGFAYQNENPIRTQNFYFRQGASFGTLPWNDFSVNANNQFRFMIEPRLKINNDLGVTDLVSPSLCAGSATTSYIVNVQNLGLLTQDFSINPLSVYGTITDPSNVVTTFGPIIINSDSLRSDGNLAVTLTNTYDMSVAGNYTFKSWTVSGSDINAINDTLMGVTRTVVVPVSAPFAQTFNTSTALPANWSTSRFFGNTGSGVSGSNSYRINVYNTSTFTANGVLNTPKITGVTPSMKLRFKYKVTDFTGGGATTLGATDSIKVLISADCGATYSYAYTISGVNHTPTTNFTPVNIDLSSYVGGGSSLLVKFVLDWYGTANNSYVDFDDIRVIDTSNDVAPVNLLGICSNLPLGAALNATTNIANQGISNVGNVRYGISISGPGSFNDLGFASNINAVADTIVAFATYNPLAIGTYTVKVFSYDSTDNDRYNDTIYSTFIVSARVNSFSISNLSTDSFTINWTGIAGATSYYLDVATDAGFTSMLGGYSNLQVIGTSQNVNGLTLGVKYYYRLRTTNLCGTSINSITDSITTLTSGATLNLTAFLQGLYLGGGVMTAAPFSADGVSSPTVADTITVELRNPDYSLAYSVSDTLSTTGQASITFPGSAVGNKYYVVIKHRSSIETWSSDSILIGSTTSYDFSSGVSQAFGDNMVDDGSGVFLVYGGDINQDGSVDFGDYPDLDIASSNSDVGYFATDLNGDSSVDFGDYPMLDLNSSNSIFSFHP